MTAEKRKGLENRSVFLKDLGVEVIPEIFQQRLRRLYRLDDRENTQAIIQNQLKQLLNKS